MKKRAATTEQLVCERQTVDYHIKVTFVSLYSLV